MASHPNLDSKGEIGARDEESIQFDKDSPKNEERGRKKDDNGRDILTLRQEMNLKAWMGRVPPRLEIFITTRHMPEVNPRDVARKSSVKNGVNHPSKVSPGNNPPIEDGENLKLTSATADNSTMGKSTY